MRNTDFGRYGRTHGGWLHMTFLVLLVIGFFFGANTDDPDPGQVERCAPITRYDDEAWQMLTDSGYVEDDGKLYRPGCEGTR